LEPRLDLLYEQCILGQQNGQEEDSLVVRFAETVVTAIPSCLDQMEVIGA
jgi:hypothetical protein